MAIVQKLASPLPLPSGFNSPEKSGQALSGLIRLWHLLQKEKEKGNDSNLRERYCIQKSNIGSSTSALNISLKF